MAVLVVEDENNPGVFKGSDNNSYRLVNERWKEVNGAMLEQTNHCKDTNPKDAVGVKKAPISTVSGGVVMELGLAMLEGARKYGRHNYREAGVRASVYRDAAWRHLTAWWDFGQDIDPDSGLSHITKAIASLMVLRDAMLMDNWVDDRPPSLPIELLEKYNEIASDIIKRHPDAKPPHVKKPRDVGQDIDF